MYQSWWVLVGESFHQKVAILDMVLVRIKQWLPSMVLWVLNIPTVLSRMA